MRVRVRRSPPASDRGLYWTSEFRSSPLHVCKRLQYSCEDAHQARRARTTEARRCSFGEETTDDRAVL